MSGLSLSFPLMAYLINISMVSNKINTSTACTDILNFVTAEHDKKRHVLSLFLDVCKAVNSLYHPILLSKLFRYSIREVEHKWFSSYLSSRFQYRLVKWAVAFPSFNIMWSSSRRNIKSNILSIV